MPLKPDINREWGYPCPFLRLPHSRQLYQSLLVPSSFQDLCSMPVRHSTCMGTAHRLTRGAYRKICITPTAIRCSRSLQSHPSRRSTRSRLRRAPSIVRLQCNSKPSVQRRLQGDTPHPCRHLLLFLPHVNSGPLVGEVVAVHLLKLTGVSQRS